MLVDGRLEGANLRTAVISDIHGNLMALDAVLTDISKQDVDEIWCAGDIAWGGPWPHECIERVRSEGWTTVRGNTDVWVTGDPQTITDEAMREELRAIADGHGITEDEATWLLALPVGHSGPGSVLMVHGTPESPFEGPMPDAPPAEFQPYEGRAGLVIYGHVHKAFVRRLADGTIVCNAGSVGLPMDGETASYVLLDHIGSDLAIRHRRIEFDRRAVLAQAKRMDDASRTWLVERFGA
jgi:predicted phosphodiesterase